MAGLMVSHISEAQSPDSSVSKEPRHDLMQGLFTEMETWPRSDPPQNAYEALLQMNEKSNEQRLREYLDRLPKEDRRELIQEAIDSLKEKRDDFSK
ncbi:MAG: hypothetical protein C5B49_06345 [Bdellovibrio sp.]|nr:MAG: hypothetical protein C5B49_06345 [Bdellovibrio sp.]